MTPAELARALNGTLNGQWINLRGPGHRSGDLSLGLRLDSSAADGYVLYSFAEDDLIECRSYVNAKLQKIGAVIADVDLIKTVDRSREQWRVARAHRIWNEAAPPKPRS